MIKIGQSNHDGFECLDVCSSLACDRSTLAAIQGGAFCVGVCFLSGCKRYLLQLLLQKLLRRKRAASVSGEVDDFESSECRARLQNDMSVEITRRLIE